MNQSRLELLMPLSVECPLWRTPIIYYIYQDCCQMSTIFFFVFFNFFNFFHRYNNFLNFLCIFSENTHARSFPCTNERLYLVQKNSFNDFSLIGIDNMRAKTKIKRITRFFFWCFSWNINPILIAFSYNGSSLAFTNSTILTFSSFLGRILRISSSATTYPFRFFLSSGYNLITCLMIVLSSNFDSIL